jgi:hypothetical protein
MLALEDSRWKDLPGNYNDGSQTAALLRQAYAGIEFDTWFEDLAQELVHQYTVSEVAYAALPHLVQLAEGNPAWRAALLILAGVCLSYGNQPPAAIAAEYEADLSAAAGPARVMLGELLSHEQDSDSDVVYMLSALAAFHNCTDLAHFIEGQEWS